MKIVFAEFSNTTILKAMKKLLRKLKPASRALRWKYPLVSFPWCDN